MRASKSHIERLLAFIKKYRYYSQAYKQEGWIDKQVKRNRMTPEIAETLKVIIPALESFYPGRWDIQFKVDYDTRVVYNKYSLVEFSQGYEDYLMHCQRRRVDGEIVYPTYEEFDASIRETPETLRYYLNDTMPWMCGTEFNVPNKIWIEKFDVIIHWPEVTIRNSESQTMDLKDIFIKLQFNSYGEIETEVQGTKTTFTATEYETGYVHSHIPSRAMYGMDDTSEGRKSKVDYQKVCLGSGEIKMGIAHYNDQKGVGEFEHILLMLGTVVSWESIEGGPHALMENVISKIKGAPKINWANLMDFFNYFITSRYISKNPDLDWFYSSGQYRIIDNEKLEDLVVTAYKSPLHIPYEFLVHKDETGEYYTPNRITARDMVPREQDHIIFQGKKVELKVEGELKFSGERKRYINPNLKNYVKQKLEYTANQIQIKADTFARLHQSNNHQRISGQSSIPL